MYTVLHILRWKVTKWNQLSFHGGNAEPIPHRKIGPKVPPHGPIKGPGGKYHKTPSTSLIHLLKVMAIMVFWSKAMPLTKCRSDIQQNISFTTELGRPSNHFGPRAAGGRIESLFQVVSHKCSVTVWAPKIHFWLVVSTHLKNISQIGHLPQLGMKMKIFETTT